MPPMSASPSAPQAETTRPDMLNKPHKPRRAKSSPQRLMTKLSRIDEVPDCNSDGPTRMAKTGMSSSTVNRKPLDRASGNGSNRQRPAIEITKSDSIEDVFDGLETPKRHVLEGGGNGNATIARAKTDGVAQRRGGLAGGADSTGERDTSTTRSSRASTTAASVSITNTTANDDRQSSSHRFQAKKKRCFRTDKSTKRVRFASRRRIHVIKTEDEIPATEDEANQTSSMPSRQPSDKQQHPRTPAGMKYTPTSSAISPRSGGSCALIRQSTGLANTSWFCSSPSLSEACSRTLQFMITGQVGTGGAYPSATPNVIPTPTASASPSAKSSTQSPAISKAAGTAGSRRSSMRNFVESARFQDLSCNENTAQEECVRGLLTPKLKTRRFETRKVAWNVVFKEQSQQSVAGIVDPDAIAQKYGSCCRSASQKARNLAMQDQEDAIEINSPPGSHKQRSSARRRQRGRSPVREL